MGFVCTAGCAVAGFGTGGVAGTAIAIGCAPGLATVGEELDAAARFFDCAAATARAVLNSITFAAPAFRSFFPLVVEPPTVAPVGLSEDEPDSGLPSAAITACIASDVDAVAPPESAGFAAVGPTAAPEGDDEPAIGVTDILMFGRLMAGGGP